MKKLIVTFSLASILLSSCVVQQPVVMSGSSLDYTSYAKNGFFLTEANSVSFEYTPIASTSYSFLSGYEIEMKDGKPVTRFNEYNKEVVKTTKNYITATREGALNGLVGEAKKSGANGIIMLNVKESGYTDPKLGYIHLGYVASGMAIKKR